MECLMLVAPLIVLCGHRVFAHRAVCTVCSLIVLCASCVRSSCCVHRVFAHRAVGTVCSLIVLCASFVRSSCCVHRVFAHRAVWAPCVRSSCCVGTVCSLFVLCASCVRVTSRGIIFFICDALDLPALECSPSDRITAQCTACTAPMNCLVNPSLF
jgi:hypothetical protein